MGNILKAAKEYFDEEEWSYTRLEGRPVLQLKFYSGVDSWHCYAHAFEDRHRLLFYSVSPINAPDNLRTEIAEYLTRANYGLVVGNFEMDWGDGEVRFKTSISMDGEALTMPLVQALVMPNLRTMGQYLPGIRAVIEQGATPLDAVSSIENQQ